MSDNKKNAALNPDNIRQFWEERAKRYQEQDLINVSNLESNTELAHEKHRQEYDVLMSYIEPEPGQEVLDLGAGHCAWSIVLARNVAHVDAVEYSEGMFYLAQRNIKAQGLTNIALYNCAAQDFESARSYDTVLLSGLTIYLNDDELDILITRVRAYLKPTGRVVLRDGTGRDAPFTIGNKYSNELDAFYSAHYRTADQYIAFFAKHGFKVRRHRDMFVDGSKLNKRKETILRVYEFYKPKGEL